MKYSLAAKAFDIVKDPTRPFLIHATSIDIKVLGTAFNVRAYPEDKTAEISLIRGRIEVSLKNRSNDKINLSPNEKLIVDNTLTITGGDTTFPAQQQQEPLVLINKLQVNPRDSTVNEIQWIDNKLVFNDELFSELAARIERKYGVEITIKDAVLEQKGLPAALQRRPSNRPWRH
nr:FecR domain-containing protein [Paraflavitalea speifideiaquila]